MPRGGKRAGSGRKAKPKFSAPAEKPQGGRPSHEDRGWAGKMIAALNRKEGPNDSYEIKRMRRFSEAKDLRIELDFVKWIYDKRDGKATQPVDHGAGGPIQVEITTNVKMPNPH